jgi:phosphatidylglycerol lysyltransferase
LRVYASGRPVGWTLDLVRRNTEAGAFRGVMEFLIATAALTFGQEGTRFVSLSGAPLAWLDRGERPSAPQRLLPVAAAVQAKFQPVYQPLYLAYPDPAALGSIAAAIGRAYLPHLTLPQARHMLTKLRWSPTG